VGSLGLLGGLELGGGGLEELGRARNLFNTFLLSWMYSTGQGTFHIRFIPLTLTDGITPAP
jgi:hypothetical protein